jgi:tetratricopeptide (TPR) repeat protein
VSSNRFATPLLQPAGHQTQLPLGAIIGPFGDAIATIVSVIEAASVLRAAAAFKGRTISYAAAGQYRSALADRGEVAGRYPGVASYYERGLAWSCMEKYDKAILDFRKALEFSDHPGRIAASREHRRSCGDLAAFRFRAIIGPNALHGGRTVSVEFRQVGNKTLN